MSYPYIENNDDSIPPLYIKANEINLPNLKLTLNQRRKDGDWIKAFEWHNQFTMRKLTMNCMPCFTKIYSDLKKAKEDFNKISK